jgi:hypothetical protein
VGVRRVRAPRRRGLSALARLGAIHNVDTLKTGGGQIVSFAVARFESRRLLPEQLSEPLTETTHRNVDVELHIEDHGLGPATK